MQSKKSSLVTNENTLNHKLTVHKMNNNNNNQINIQHQAASLAFSQMISKSSYQFPISFNKDQLYETFTLFQNCLKTNSNQPLSSIPNQSVIQRSLSDLPIENKTVIKNSKDDEEGRGINNAMVNKDDDIDDDNDNEKDNSRNDILSSTMFDTNNAQFASTTQNKINNNYDDKPIKPLSTNFLDLLEKNLAIDDNLSKKTDNNKNLIKECKFQKNPRVKSNKKQINKKHSIHTESPEEDWKHYTKKRMGKSLKKDDLKNMTFLNTTLQHTTLRQDNIKDKDIMNNDTDVKEIQRPLSTHKFKETLIKKNRKSNSTTLQITPNKMAKNGIEIQVKTNYNQLNLKTRDKPKIHTSITNDKLNSKNNLNKYKDKDKTNQVLKKKEDKSNIKKPFININKSKGTKSFSYRSDFSSPIKTEDNITVKCKVDTKEHSKLTINRDQAIKKKMEELNVELVNFKIEKEKVDKLKEEYEKLHCTLQDHISKFNCRKSEFEVWKQGETKRIIKEKDKLNQDIKQINSIKENSQNMHFSSKKDKEEIDLLRSQIAKIQNEILHKESSDKKTIEKLKRQIEELNIKEDVIRNKDKAPSQPRVNIIYRDSTPVAKKVDGPFKIHSTSNSTRSNSKQNSNLQKMTISVNTNNTNTNTTSTPTRGEFRNSNESKMPQTQGKVLKWESQNPSIQLNTNSHKTQETCSIIKEEPIESFDFVLPEKYHGKEFKLINQEKSPDGKIVKYYNNQKREIIFNSGLRKEMFEDGYQIVYFTNGDIKQVFPDNKSVYFFKEAKTVQTCFDDGVQIFKFNNGQMEKHDQEGNKKIIFPDGTIRTISKEGNDETFYSNRAATQKEDKTVPKSKDK